MFLSSKAKNAQAAEGAQALTPPWLKGLRHNKVQILALTMSVQHYKPLVRAVLRVALHEQKTKTANQVELCCVNKTQRPLTKLSLSLIHI